MPKKKKLKKAIKNLRKQLKKAKTFKGTITGLSTKNPVDPTAVVYNPDTEAAHQYTIFETFEAAAKDFADKKQPGSKLLIPCMHIVKQVDLKKKTAKTPVKA
jgi:hypothetical protein